VALGGPALAAAGWLIATMIGQWGHEGRLPGLMAIGIVAVIAVIAVTLLRPWRGRPILAWGSLLIAASTGRIVATIAICLLLYSAARQPAAPLLFGALSGLVPVLAGETFVASRRFRQRGG